MSDTMEYMVVDTVKELIDNKGSKIATVTFIKLDGSTRVCNGLFKPVGHIVGSEKGFTQGQQMKDRGQQPMYDLAKKRWISFYLDKVTDFK